MKLDYMRYMFLCDSVLCKDWFRNKYGGLCQWNAHLMKREDYEHFDSSIPEQMVDEGLFVVRYLDKEWGDRHGLVLTYDITDLGKAYAYRHLSLRYKKLHNKTKHLITKEPTHE